MRVPEGYDLLATVNSHGWMLLAPFSRLPEGFTAVLDRREIRVTQPGGPGTALRVEGGEHPRLRRILALDWDLADFHRRVRRRKGLAWIADRGLGRIVRAGDLFEDLVKLILTTNCTWAQTVAMCERLVRTLGPGFPAPAALAAAGEEGLKALGTGYRARSLAELATVDLTGWESLPPEELRPRLLGLRGIGPYAADHMLMMLGHCSRVPVDSWLRDRASRLLFDGRPAPPKAIQAHYAGLGRWAGLAAWFDLNREAFAVG